MSRDRRAWQAVDDGFPRVSGDEPPVATLTAVTRPFSPRERG